MRRLIFVGGIHGVGKTTMCAAIAAELGVEHLSAGEMIRAYRRDTADTCKAVRDVQGNQDTLVEALEQRVIASNGLLLDGHFCLLHNGNIVDVPTATFVGLRPIGCIVVVDDVNAIAARLLARDGTCYSPDLLGAMAQSEIRRATEVCEQIACPLLVASPDENQRACAFARGFMRS